MTPLSPTTILSRAEASVGFGHNTYSARSNNCEHKATDVRYARPVSLQATYWEELCKAVLFVIIFCLGSVILRLIRQFIDLLSCYNTDARYDRPVSLHLQATYWEELCKAVFCVGIMCFGPILYRLLRQVIEML